MSREFIIEAAVRDALDGIAECIADDMRAVLIREVRQALQEREPEFTALVKTAVESAMRS